MIHEHQERGKKKLKGTKSLLKISAIQFLVVSIQTDFASPFIMRGEKISMIGCDVLESEEASAAAMRTPAYWLRANRSCLLDITKD